MKDLSLVLFKLPIPPRLSLGTFVGNVIVEYFRLPTHTVRRFRGICYGVTMRVDSFQSRKQRHGRSMVDVRGTALRRACRLPQGEPDGGSEGREFRSGRSPRDGPGRGGPAWHDRPNCRRPGTQRSDSRQACDADACCRGTCSRARGQARRDGQEGPADCRARPGGCPRRPRRKDGHARRPQGLAGAPEVSAPARGAEVERARGRAGEGGARSRQGRRGAVAALGGAA